MALKFLNKKGWHTGSLRNIENVWKAEQKHGQEQKKLEELRKQIISEREAQEFRQLQEQAGLVPKQERLDFLYDSGLSVGKPSTEDYLLGKPIDQLKEESDISKVAATPGSLFVDEKPYSANEQWRKIHSDPLLLIRQQEQAALSRIKNNPVKMEMIKKEVENKKRKKEEKRRLKAERKKQKREEKKKMSKAYDNSSDSSSDDGGGSRNSESVIGKQPDDKKVYSKSTDFGRSLEGRISRDDYDKHVDHSTKDKKGDWSAKRSSSSHSYERNCSDNNHNHKDKKEHRSSEHLFKESSPSSDRRQEYYSGGDHDYKDKKRHHSDEERGHKLRGQEEYKPRARDRETSKESSPPSTYDKEPRTSHSRSCGTGDLEFKRASSSRPIDANGRPLPPLPKKQIKLSEEERNARLLEMQKDADLHEEQRWQRLKNASVADALEQQRDAIKSSGHNFLDSTNRSVYGTEKGGSASVEESVRRRTHFLEKHRSEDSSRAFRR